MLTPSRTDVKKSYSRRPSEYEIVEKSRSPHDDFSKKQRKLAFFCFPKIICCIYIAFIRRKVNNILVLNIWPVFNVMTYLHVL